MLTEFKTSAISRAWDLAVGVAAESRKDCPCTVSRISGRAMFNRPLETVG